MDMKEECTWKGNWQLPAGGLPGHLYIYAYQNNPSSGTNLQRPPF